MKINNELLAQIVSDLGLDKPFVKGQTITIRNCWHFSTDGNRVDQLFYNEDDFIAGMNRIYVVFRNYQVVILAFSLMDTHVHFVLYGTLEACNRFMHDYIRRTSRYIALVYGDNKKMYGVPIHYQHVNSDMYLKTVICYTVKNAPVGGIPYMGWDYPWSSGPLYFRKASAWSSPAWMFSGLYDSSDSLGSGKKRTVFRTKRHIPDNIPMWGHLVFPGEYVAYELVEHLFKTCKSFNFFMCITREDDIDSRGGTISHLSIPIQEMRQHRTELCNELYGTNSVKGLSTAKRLRLARTLRARYNSSIKQIVRLCGLVYGEVKDII